MTEAATPTSPFESLPDDIALAIIGYLDLKALVILSSTCKAIRRVCEERIAWIRAYKASNLPLPQLDDSSSDADFKSPLIHAAKLDQKWSAAQPKPCHTIKLNAATWTMSLFRSRYLLTFATSNVVCWDLQPPENLHAGEGVRISWGASLHHRPLVMAVADVEYKGTKGILIAYTPNSNASPKDCYLLYTPIEEDDPCPTPRQLPIITCPHSIKAIALGKTEVALMTSDNILIVQDLTTHVRRLVTLTEDAVGMWIISVVLADSMVLVARHRGRGIVVDAYLLPPPDPNFTSSSVKDMPAAISSIDPSSILLQHVQTVSLSSIRQTGTNLSEVDIVASSPEGIELHRLSMTHPQPRNSPPDLNIRLVARAYDSTEQPRPPRSSSQPSPSVETPPEDQDGYDSDSTLSIVLQPTQVVDLHLGSLGRRALAIQASANTNDRSIWLYTSKEDEQNGEVLVSKRLRFSGLREPSQTTEDGEAVSKLSEDDDDIQVVLRSHACRVIIDELQGRIIVAADCEQIFVLRYI